MEKFAKRLEKIAKKAAFALLRRLSPVKSPMPIHALHDVARILVVRPNFRIGNAILSTAIIGPLRERFPGAAIDFLVTDKTATLFENLPVDQVFAASRSAITRPWLAVSMLRRLRANHYDLVVQLANSSLSGLLVSRLVGARYVMGKPKGEDPWYDIKVMEPSTHAYDTCVAFSRSLGSLGPVKAQFVASRAETERAQRELQALGLTVEADGKAEPFIAVFVGGHAGKVCPLSFWIALMQGLDQLGMRFVTFVGPEEKAMIPDLRKALETVAHGALCPPVSIRIFAAMLAHARYMITPDSGPMHMAAALGVPVVMMARLSKSLDFVPPGPRNHIVWDLDVGQVLVALRAYREDDYGSLQHAGSRVPAANVDDALRHTLRLS